MQRTKEIIKKFDIKNEEELTNSDLQSDVNLIADVFEKFTKTSIEEYGINPLYCVSLPGYTWQCEKKYANIKLQTHQDKDMIFFLENNFRGGISSVMGDRYENFPFAPENKKNKPAKFSDYIKKIKPDTYTQTKKLICDWSDKKNYLVHHRMLQF